MTKSFQVGFMVRLFSPLGLNEPIVKSAFDALCDNRHPNTLQKLTQRGHANRTIGYDINFHFPKSVPALHVLSKDDHVLDAFRDLVNETIRDIQTDAQTRIRKGQSKKATGNRLTGELVWSEFIHETARPVKHMALTLIGIALRSTVHLMRLRIALKRESLATSSEVCHIIKPISTKCYPIN